VGYLGHLALARAEAGGPAAAAWLGLAGELVRMTPVDGPGDPCAAASLHVRLGRLERPAPPRRGPPAPPDRPWKATAEPPPAPAPGGAGEPRKRWRLFG
jgi:hypothetical protein